MTQLAQYDPQEVRATFRRIAKSICRYHASEINRLETALGVTAMVMQGRAVSRRNGKRRHADKRR